MGFNRRIFGLMGDRIFGLMGDRIFGGWAIGFFVDRAIEFEKNVRSGF
ncbi:hypothetical protein [Microcoleus sp. B4-D4]